MTYRLAYQVTDLAQLRQMWQSQVASGRLFLPAQQPAPPLRAEVVVVVTVEGSSMPLELPGEVVMSDARGLGLVLKVPGYVHEAAEHMMAQRWGDAAALLLLGEAQRQSAASPRGARPARSSTQTQTLEPGRFRKRRPVPRAQAARPERAPSPPKRPRTPPARLQTPVVAATSAPAKPRKAKPEKLSPQAAMEQAQSFLIRYKDADHYRVMGVARDAGRRDIRRAYSVLMMKFHPDNYFKRAEQEVLDVLEEAYQRITQAYETLMVPEQRTNYDMKIGNYRGGQEQDLGQWRRASFERANPQKARMGAGLFQEARAAHEKGQLQSALSKLRLALQFHPHLAEAKVLKDELEKKG
jgi:hypothetical protein